MSLCISKPRYSLRRDRDDRSSGSSYALGAAMGLSRIPHPYAWAAAALLAVLGLSRSGRQHRVSDYSYSSYQSGAIPKVKAEVHQAEVVDEYVDESSDTRESARADACNNNKPFWECMDWHCRDKYQDRFGDRTGFTDPGIHCYPKHYQGKRWYRWYENARDLFFRMSADRVTEGIILFRRISEADFITNIFPEICCHIDPCNPCDMRLRELDDFRLLRQ